MTLSQWYLVSDCRQVPERQCKIIERQVCESFPAEECQRVPKVESFWWQPKALWASKYLEQRQCLWSKIEMTFLKEQCRTVQREECFNLPKKVCNETRPREVCEDFQSNQCSLVPKKSCSMVPVEKCEDTARKECNIIPRIVGVFSKVRFF